MAITINFPHGNLKIIQSPINETVNIYLWPQVNNEVRLYCEYTGNNTFKIISPKQRLFKKYKKLIIIVESPHKDEFDSLFVPVRPLNGKSGKRFNKEILNKLKNWFTTNSNGIALLNGDVLEIHIVNPVKYQTSLHHFLNGMIPYDLPINNQGNYTNINANIRDEVWRVLFSELSVKQDFINYIRTNSPDYVVNCCTGSNHNKISTFILMSNLNISHRKIQRLKLILRQELIDNVQNKILTDFYYIEDIHPVKW